jgi:hypothetical protein
MTWSYDVTTQNGLMRLMIPDRDVATPIFTDEELAAFLVAELQVTKRATALALETIASDRAMVLQVITTNGLSTNGATLSTAICARAKALREQADMDDARAGGLFDYAEEVTGNFGFRERMWSEIMRDQGGITP